MDAECDNSGDNRLMMMTIEMKKRVLMMAVRMAMMRRVKMVM